MEQIIFGGDDFAGNPEPRCPCTLVLDTSGSMSGAAITELNEGLAVLQRELMRDSLAFKRVEIAVITFGPVEVKHLFEIAPNFKPMKLYASGETPMGEAIEKAIDLTNGRKEEYRANGIAYYRPWIFLITDGAPTDDVSGAKNQIRQGEAAKNFAFFPIGVSGADMDSLRLLSVRSPIKLSGLKFKELFTWLSSSLKSVSRSSPGESVALPPPDGWSEV